MQRFKQEKKQELDSEYPAVLIAVVMLIKQFREALYIKNKFSINTHTCMHAHTHTHTPTFLSFIEAVLSIEAVAMVIQGTHGEKRRRETS